MEEKTLRTNRLTSQQLTHPQFQHPKDLVNWMGAIQAQDYPMAKWAVALRLQTATNCSVDEALQKGEILRLHIMRPTWHLVAAENVRWMLKLSARRIQSANNSLGKKIGITEELYQRCNRLLEKMLEGHRHLTRQEIGEELAAHGITTDIHGITRLLIRAETEGIVCNGIDRGKQTTYALLDERVPPTPELHPEEALARLATLYFRSHSPASLDDFIWWSGLSIREARQATDSIASELTKEHFAGQDLFVHQSCEASQSEDVLHFLPPFDEYLIGYKDRTAVLKPEHQAKAFNTFGIFYPVVMHNGTIVGNWDRDMPKNPNALLSSSFFEKADIREESLKAASDKYRTFIGR